MAVKLLRWILVLTIVSFATWQLAPHIKDFKQIYNLKDRINYLFLILSVFSQFGQYVGDGWLSFTLLRVTKTKISFKNTVKIASMNVFAANLLPVGQAGALATAFYFYKKLGVTNQNFIFLSLCWSIITTFTLFTIFCVSLFFLPEFPEISFSFKKTGLITLAAILTLALLSIFSRTLVWPRVRAFVKRSNLYNEIILFRKNFPDYNQAISKNSLLFTQAFIAASIFYFSNILTLTLSFLTFGIMPPIAIVSFAYTLGLVAGWITLAPAGIGATEATMLLIFLQFNIPPAQAVASILLFRIMSFWLPIPLGALAYFSLNRQFKKIK